MGLIDNKFDYFMDKFLSDVNVAFPVMYVKNYVYRNNPAKSRWYTDDILKVKEQCFYMYNKFSSTGSPIFRTSYLRLKSRYKFETA